MKSIPNSSPDKEIIKAFEAAGVVDLPGVSAIRQENHVGQF